MPRLFDVRPGEMRGKVAGFFTLLLLLIGAHTVLETARDALLLTGPGPRALGLVYMAIAAGTLPGSALVARAGERFGQRRALAATLVVAVAGPLALFALPMSHAGAMATYVLSGILGSILIPQFWTLAGTALTVGQGRRLFGLISAGGVAGGVLGPALASGVLLVSSVRVLLLVSSAVFLLAIGGLGLVPATERVATRGDAPAKIPLTASLRALRERPFLGRLALVVLVSTATLLALDYLFKSSVARAMPAASVGPFVAHYYLGLNVASLLVQLFGTGALVRRAGVLPALVLTPLLLLVVALGAALGRGALGAVLLLKGVDGSLRYSVHRVSGELVYLPVPPTERQRAKPLIDGGLARVAQTATGAALLALGGTRLLDPPVLAVGVAALACAWLALVITLRRPYLALLRDAISRGSFGAAEDARPIDLETAQMLVQCLSSDDPLEVRGAMSALARRGRDGLVPALVLLHRDEAVLTQALELFGASSRADWFTLARRLLRDPRERVRLAAARALARHAQLEPSSLAHDVGWQARGYAALLVALRRPSAPILEHPAVAPSFGRDGGPGDAARLGMLAAIADAAPNARLLPVLRALAARPAAAPEWAELLARAAESQRDDAVAPVLIQALRVRQGREAVREALVTLGGTAYDDLQRMLTDPTCDRRLRVHVPKTLARFATRRAADRLLEALEGERDELVRHKTIRALGSLVAEHRIFVDAGRVERLCVHELERSFRRLALALALDGPGERASSASQAEARALLLQLVREDAARDVKLAFQLLQIAHPRQGVHRAYLAVRSHDAYARSNAAELLDTLLRRGRQQRLRDLLRLVTDDLPVEDRVDRARAIVPSMSRTAEEAMYAVASSTNPMWAALARHVRGLEPCAVREARAAGADR